jgi:hypothetical protein
LGRLLEQAVLSMLLASAACEEARVEPVAAVVAAPAPDDRGALCADVGEIRACWGDGLAGGECAGGACVVARPLPASPRSASGWRCTGMGRHRACVPRARGVAQWQCDERTCLQRHPRRPDQGEWDCAEVDGVVRCIGGHPAAGVPEAPPDPGWVCGARGGGADRRICVDFEPDVPDTDLGGDRDGWKCRFLRREGLSRSCERVAGAAVPRLGGTCSDARGCPKGALCAAGRCLPPWPKPSCYLDEDCGAGRACRFGSCAGGE